MVEWRQCPRAPIAWCALAGAVAVALKFHFSAAAASDLQWMLHPLAWLLQSATGWGFQRDAAGNWESRTAGLVLVKACAGINFMVMSFIGWCWMLRPRAQAWSPWQWPLRLVCALACAWLLALCANALRIVAIVTCQPLLEHWLAPVDAHRALGLAVYLAVLSLQWLLCDWRNPARALLLASGVYGSLMLGVPLAHGSAFAAPSRYGENAASVLIALMPLLCAIGYLQRTKKGSPVERGSLGR